MKLVWTPEGAVQSVTLGDDVGASGPRKTIQVESLTGECEMQEDRLAFAEHPALRSGGNVAGDLTVVVTQSFADLDAASVFLLTEYGRIGQRGDLAWARAGTLFRFRRALLRHVEPVEINGVKIRQRYIWRIGAMEIEGGTPAADSADTTADATGQTTDQY